MTVDPYWNHNTHYHPWILDRIPASARTALDIGCGDGLLAHKLGDRGLTVRGIDLDDGILEATTSSAQVTFTQADFLDFPGTFDVVTAVASLHHVPLHDGLKALHRLVAPGGTLAVVGLWQITLVADLPYLALVPGIVAIDALHRPRLGGPGVQLTDPEEIWTEIRSAATELLPGVRLRRRLLYRYTLLWRSPNSRCGPLPK